jgi:hypothetical protein
MNKLRSGFIALAFTLTIVAAGAAYGSSASAQDSFNTLKTLTGSWEGKSSQGQPLTVTYKVTGGGSALMSEIEGKEDMISMFHIDHDRLLLTHYCSAGNQPRMQAAPSQDGKTFTFNFVDGTNIGVSKVGHMQRVTFTIVDPDHHTEEWVFVQDGKELKRVFDLQRSKATNAGTY